MNIKNILDLKVSFQKDTWASFSKEMTIKEVLIETQNGKLKDRIEYLRNLLLNNDLIHKILLILYPVMMMQCAQLQCIAILCRELF